MLREVNTSYLHYFKDAQDRYQGEYKEWHENGRLFRQCFYKDGDYHGEFKQWHTNGVLFQHFFCNKGKVYSEFKEWWEDGKLGTHCFYINNERISFDVIPYPTTPEDLTYFKLKYDFQLLPQEAVC